MRLPAYDYSQAGAYFITVCTHSRGALWQRSYYEHVIRNEKALNRIRDYIANNPARWADDPDNISRLACAEQGRV